MKLFLWLVMFLTYAITPVIAVIAVVTFFAGGWFVGIMWFCWINMINALYNDYGAMADARRKGWGSGSTFEWLLRALRTYQPNPSHHTVHMHGTDDFGLSNGDLGYNVPVVPVNPRASVCHTCHAAWPLPSPRRCKHCGTSLDALSVQHLA